MLMGFLTLFGEIRLYRSLRPWELEDLLVIYGVYPRVRIRSCRKVVRSDQADPANSEDTVQRRVVSPTPSLSRTCIDPVQVEAETTTPKDLPDPLLKEALKKKTYETRATSGTRCARFLDAGWHPRVRQSESCWGVGV